MKKLISKIHKTPKHFKQFIKFCIVGTLSLIVNIAVYTVLTRYFLLYYIAADVVAYMIALINSYLLNRSFTFRNKHKKVGVQFAKYILIYVVGMTASAVLLYIFVGKFGLYDLFAKLLVVGIITIWNFFASKFLIFDRDERKDAKTG